jgi:hypothetical protein
MRSLALLLLLSLAGCALFPLSEADCKPSSWRSVGYADGYSGANPQDLRLIPECRERYGVTVDRDEYLAGWKDGHDEWDRIQGSMSLEM